MKFIYRITFDIHPLFSVRMYFFQEILLERIIFNHAFEVRPETIGWKRQEAIYFCKLVFKIHGRKNGSVLTRMFYVRIQNILGYVSHTLPGLCRSTFRNLFEF